MKNYQSPVLTLLALADLDILTTSQSAKDDIAKDIFEILL